MGYVVLTFIERKWNKCYMLAGKFTIIIFQIIFHSKPATNAIDNTTNSHIIPPYNVA
jgi:hypothetical protein